MKYLLSADYYYNVGVLSPDKVAGFKLSFYGTADNANAAAHLFSELFCTVKSMMINYAPKDRDINLRHARESYARGLCRGYFDLSQRLQKERDDLDQRSKASLHALAVYDDNVLKQALVAIEKDSGKARIVTTKWAPIHFESFKCGEADSLKLKTGQVVE